VTAREAAASATAVVAKAKVAVELGRAVAATV
jgi:hypothetical protein